jgi:hypothetical protein
MDPVTLIVTALAAGASAGGISALQDDVKEAIKSAHSKLRGLAQKRVAGRQVAEMALAQYEADPKAWEAPLTVTLTEVGAADDADLVAAAEALMKLVDQAGASAGKYNVTIHGGQGIQVGDHNTQTNTFGA